MKQDKLKNNCEKLSKILCQLQEENNLTIGELSFIAGVCYVSILIAVENMKKEGILSLTELVINEVMIAEKKLNKSANDEG